jgi:hypothetical protein
MIDKAEIIETDKKITGFKSVSGNEPFFQGPFSRSADHAGRLDCGGHGAIGLCSFLGET